MLMVFAPRRHLFQILHWIHPSKEAVVHRNPSVLYGQEQMTDPVSLILIVAPDINGAPFSRGQHTVSNDMVDTLGELCRIPITILPLYAELIQHPDP